MPAFILDSTPCVISGKIIKPGDGVVRFTLWPGSSPLGINHDDVALRSEFNRWEHKEAAIEILSQAWRENFYSLRNVNIIHDNEYYLLPLGKLNTEVSIWFLKHAFYFSIYKPLWSSFCYQITRNLSKITIELSANHQLTIKKDNEFIKICYKVNPLQKGIQDYIKVTHSEWSHFLSIISKNKDMLLLG